MDGGQVYTRKNLPYVNKLKALSCFNLLELQEIPENGADVSHLNYLHSSPIFAGSDLRSSFSKFWKFAQHNWDASWQPNEGDEKHTAELTLRQEAYLLGYKIPFTDFYVTAKQVLIDELLY